MATLADLRAQLAAKGYNQSTPTAAERGNLPVVTLHLHPLITHPVVLVGEDGAIAKEYQTTLVTQAITPR